MLEKLKSLLLNDHIFFGSIVILVGIGSFALGRASVTEFLDKTPELKLSSTKELVSANLIQATPVKELTINEETLEVEELVASKSGTKYHLSSCAGAKQIKAENKITFSSRQAAEAAGYKPAANCPQLQ